MMKAYDMAMIVIFINAGYAIMDQIGVFGNAITQRASGFDGFSWLSTPVVTIPGVNLAVTGILAISVAIALGTVVILNTNVVNDRGLAIAMFAFIFYTSIFLAGDTVFQNYDLPGIEIFYTIYILACTMIFLIAVIQMPVGGMKSHV